MLKALNTFVIDRPSRLEEFERDRSQWFVSGPGNPVLFSVTTELTDPVNRYYVMKATAYRRHLLPARNPNRAA